MTWVRIESAFFRHRKVLSLKLGAKLLFIGGLCYSAENGTDGYVSKDALRVLAAELDLTRPAPLVTLLENAGLWHKDAGGWHIHDYLAYQPSAAQERQRRQEHADRMKDWRDRKAKRDTTSDTPRDTARDTSRDSHRALSPNPNPNPTTSSSTEEPPRAALAEDEDACFTEARRRLHLTTSTIGNPDAWVQATAHRLHLEGWTPPIPRPQPNCPTCNDLPLADPCPDCTPRSRTA